jgi:hypothetical protein
MHRSVAKMATDPTYPLFPVCCIVCSALILLLLTTSLVRQPWNLGVFFRCVWLFLELLTYGVDTVIWSNNADIKLYVYCDIGEFDCPHSALPNRTVHSIPSSSVYLHRQAGLHSDYHPTPVQGCIAALRRGTHPQGGKKPLLSARIVVFTSFQRRCDLAVELCLGAGFPAFVTGVLCKRLFPN